jgi:hypothetical protein
MEDPATLAALLRVHRELELEPRLRQLGQEILSLVGSERGWVVSPSEEPGGSAALQALGASGPEPSMTGALEDLDGWTDQEREFPGEGRFGGVGPRCPRRCAPACAI